MDTHTMTDGMGYETILVPLDGSRASEEVLPLAAALARASNATIHLVRVHAPLLTSVDVGCSLPELEKETRENELEYLASTARRFVTDARVPTATRLLDGSVGPAIEDYVRRVGVTLVVISTHGRTGLSRLWLGSTTDWLMRFLPVPVLAVGPHGHGIARAPSLEHVLIALDGSARSEAIIPEAIRIGRPSGARYTLLHVVPTADRELIPYATRTFPPVYEERRTMELMRRAKQHLDEIAQSLRRELAGLALSTEVVAHDFVAEAILQRAKRGDVDVIALSSRGRGASPLLVGSVADKVLKSFTGALLVLGPVAGGELESGTLAIPHESEVRWSSAGIADACAMTRFPSTQCRETPAA